MHNYVAIVDSEDFQLTDEVDLAKWLTIDEAYQRIKPHSLAQHFLTQAIHNIINP